MARPYGDTTKLVVAACAERPRTINQLSAITQSPVAAMRFLVWKLVRRHYLRSLRLFTKLGDRSRMAYAPGAIALPAATQAVRTRGRAPVQFRPARRLTAEQVDALHVAFRIRYPVNLPGELRTVRAADLLMRHEHIQRLEARGCGFASSLCGSTYSIGALSRDIESMAA